ncbi:DUF1911 domain-containing protein [Leucobacter insecticola]|uniref:DUF1911 domain-containing protein n=1 Tax=Leucobacter insecticola TaxID=2714934 RepID=A0A6G8FJZ2_9MICO|nr:PoNe immunity protein domain-containing protein [Leucobacter insecticola]QIM16613.1 DUF1911 domain-containing protein [Leucobacter insecticola]
MDRIDLRDLSRIYFDVLKLSYSLGAAPEDLREYLDPAVDLYVEYQREDGRMKSASKGQIYSWQELPTRQINAAQLLSVVVVIGTPEQRARIGEVLEVRGPEPVLEFLAGLRDDSIDGAEAGDYPPRPYGRLLKVIQAAPEKRPKLMADFVKHWYNGCRKAQWWGDHLSGPRRGKPVVYSGYWCFEAAAVTQLLGIDDSLYRDNEYYPRDIFIKRD